MATNNFLAFCQTDLGTNLLTQAQYAAAADRTSGNQPGIASSKLNNKALRQAAVIASQIAQYIGNKTGLTMLDDGDLATILANMVVAFGPTTQEYDITNLTLVPSVAANALTIAIKTKANNADPSATDLITAGMRSATLTSGVYLTRTLNAALSIVVPSSATLGQVNGQPSRIHCYFIDNAGALELAVSHSFYPEDALVTTTTISSGATSATAIYSTTGRSNVALRYLGYLLNTQATAGTWVTAPAQAQLTPSQNFKGPTVQTFTSSTGTYITPAGCKYIRVRMCGGGGGGGGSANVTGDGGTGGTGGTSTFGTTLLSCAGGVGGQMAAIGGAGGVASLGSGPIGMAISGGRGGAGAQTTTAATYMAGGIGGSNTFGGAGSGGPPTIAGAAGVTNTGAGGGGGGGVNSAFSGSGGGSSGFLDAIINTPLASYAYAIGAAGTAGSAGTAGFAGGPGGSGFIIVEEYYN